MLESLLLPFIIGACIAAPILVWSYVESRGVLAFLGKRPIAISDVVDGETVTIRGTVETIQKVEAPFSQQQCSAFKLTISRRDGYGELVKWVDVFDERQSRDFAITDKHGKRAIVDGTSLRLYVSIAKKGTNGDEESKAFIAMRVAASKGVFFTKKLSAREWVLKDGQTVEVHGVASLEPDPNAQMEPDGYRGAKVRNHLRISGVDGAPVMVREVWGIRPRLQAGRADKQALVDGHKVE